ncbi:uncharacterized protein LOC106169328 [Lingula anatina]|uniref:Uncharacterized protein LOC106169328 n=1 Tax=Lingula anatina TaxID=7574 RepID=A0A1S3J1R2_LINAN|nr:uncharacterized protein LOC106169328 [Lingula anatina]|eukprot:XP_013404201.1 uncharacterized protein LOC106169328 [Lingula anatina]
MEDVHGSHWLIYRCAIVAVNTKCLRFYSIQNGAILQELDNTEITCGSPLDVWNSMARIQSAGFWCNSGIYGIKMTKSSQWTKVSGGAVPLNLCGKQNLAAQMVVEEAHNYYKSKCVNPNTDLAKDLLLNMKVFQSPALVIALLQQGRENSSNPELSSVLKEIQKQYGSENSKLLHTKLNQLVGPLLQEYWRLEDKVQALMKDDKPALKHREQTLKDVIVGIVQGDSSLEARRSQLELLADSFPFDVLETLIEYLDLSTEDLSQEALRKWAPILASEEGSSGSTFPLFEILCRLLYTEKPEQLISFVKMSQAISDRISGTSAFMRRKEEHQFYERALECVGEPERSGKVESAAIAQASLVLNSGMQASQVQALHILLKYHLWVPSIKLVQQLADHSDLHLELFQLLLTAVLKAGVFATYCASIMEAVPDRISMPEFLSLLQTHTKGGPLSTKEDHIFSSDEQDTKMGAIKPFLLKMIGDR